MEANHARIRCVRYAFSDRWNGLCGMKLPRFFRTLTDNNCTPEWLMVVAAMHICLDSDGVVPSEVLRRWKGLESI
jgi:hypothetical protein